ncbi:MAG: hypothetical protein ACRD6X_14645 [Pyrinomonadaceae bacterium]
MQRARNTRVNGTFTSPVGIALAYARAFATGQKREGGQACHRSHPDIALAYARAFATGRKHECERDVHRSSEKTLVASFVFVLILY